MRAHRCINAAAAAEVFLAHHLVIQGFAHAVQALVLEIFAQAHLVNRRQGVGIMGGKLRKHRILRRQKLARTRQIGNIGVHFAGVNRIALKAVHLRPFHFAVPIRAFHQAYHQLLFVAPRQIHQIINHKRAALLISLHHKTDAVKAGQIGVGHQRFHQIERQFEPVGFFGVDIQTDIVLFGQ